MENQQINKQKPREKRTAETPTISDVAIMLSSLNPLDAKDRLKATRLIEKAAKFEATDAEAHVIYSSARSFFKPSYIYDLRVAIRGIGIKLKSNSLRRKLFSTVKEQAKQRASALDVPLEVLRQADLKPELIENILSAATDQEHKLELAALLYTIMLCEGSQAAIKMGELAILRALAAPSIKKSSSPYNELLVVLEAKNPAQQASKLWRLPALIWDSQASLAAELKEATLHLAALQRQAEHLELQLRELRRERDSLTAEIHLCISRRDELAETLQGEREKFIREHTYSSVQAQSIRNGMLEKITRAVEHQFTGIRTTLKSVPDEQATLISHRLSNVEDTLADFRSDF